MTRVTPNSGTSPGFVPTTAPKPVQVNRGAPMAGASSQSYTIAAGDVGRTTFQFGGRAYTLTEEIGRPIAQSDVGHVLTESYTPDGWVLSIA